MMSNSYLPKMFYKTPRYGKSNEEVMTEAEELRGISNQHLAQCPDLQLVMIALAVMMEAAGVEDEPLITELRRRAVNP